MRQGEPRGCADGCLLCQLLRVKQLCCLRMHPAASVGMHASHWLSSCRLMRTLLRLGCSLPCGFRQLWHIFSSAGESNP